MLDTKVEEEDECRNVDGTGFREILSRYDVILDF